MIAALAGVLAERRADAVVVDVGGVGYLVHVSTQTLAGLPAAGEAVKLRCHTHVREDALQIFGFLAEGEQQLFALLIGVSGIGPKLAMTALSGMPAVELVRAIAGEELRRLQSIPGIGKKTAERIVVELRERCALLARELPAAAPDEAPPRLAAARHAGEVVEALAGLGYKRATAEKAVARVLERVPDFEALTVEALLRSALGLIRDV